MEKRRTAAIITVIVVIAGGFGVYKWRTGGSEPEKTGVQTAKVQAGTVAPTLAMTGYVSSVDERQVNSNSSGEILEVLATVGNTVTAGQPLLKLDTSGAQQDVNIAYANLVSARARLQELRDQEASGAQIASQDAAVLRASADYQNAVDSRDSATVNSPINGTVIAVNARVGDQTGGGSSGGSTGTGGAAASGSAGTASANSSSNLFTIADLGRLQVTAAVDQADVAKVAVGQTVDITLDALPRRKFTGKVAAVDPIAQTNQNVVTYNAYITIDTPGPGMRLGMSSNLEINLEKHENVVYIPNVAVRARGDEQFVSKMIDGELTEVAVKTGLVAADRTEIVSGLSKGDEIAVQSFTSADGQSSGTFGGGGFGGGFGGGGMAVRGR